MGLFNSKPSSTVTAHDRAVLELKIQRDKLTVYRTKVERCALSCAVFNEASLATIVCLTLALLVDHETTGTRDSERQEACVRGQERSCSRAPQASKAYAEAARPGRGHAAEHCRDGACQ